MANPVLQQKVLERAAELDRLKPAYESAKAVISGPAAKHFISRAIAILSLQITSPEIALVQLGRLAEAAQPLIESEVFVVDYESRERTLAKLRESDSDLHP